MVAISFLYLQFIKLSHKWGGGRGHSVGFRIANEYVNFLLIYGLLLLRNIRTALRKSLLRKNIFVQKNVFRRKIPEKDLYPHFLEKNVFWKIFCVNIIRCSLMLWFQICPSCLIKNATGLKKKMKNPWETQVFWKPAECVRNICAVFCLHHRCRHIGEHAMKIWLNLDLRQLSRGHFSKFILSESPLGKISFPAIIIPI